MEQSVKSKIFKMVEGIDDENVLRMVMEDVAFYAGKQDVTDELNADQLKELDAALKEADNKDTIDWSDFKKEMGEWKKG